MRVWKEVRVRSWVSSELILEYGAEVTQPVVYDESNEWGFKPGPLLKAEKKRFMMILSDYGELMSKQERWRSYEQEVQTCRRSSVPESEIQAKLKGLSREWLELEVEERGDMELAHLQGKLDRATALASDHTRSTGPPALSAEEQARLNELKRTRQSKVLEEAEWEARRLREERLAKAGKGRGRGRGRPS
jgi:hypothetical protein